MAVDIGAIGAVLSSVKTATEIVKAVRESKSTIADAERNFKMAELMTALADARTGIAEVQEEILERDVTIRELENALSIRGSLVYEAPAYYVPSEDGKREGPYCQPCYDSHQRLVRLQGRGDGRWTCMVCKTVVCEERFLKAYEAKKATTSRRTQGYIG